MVRLRFSGCYICVILLAGSFYQVAHSDQQISDAELERFNRSASFSQRIAENRKRVTEIVDLARQNAARTPTALDYFNRNQVTIEEALERNLEARQELEKIFNEGNLRIQEGLELAARTARSRAEFNENVRRNEAVFSGIIEAGTSILGLIGKLQVLEDSETLGRLNQLSESELEESETESAISESDLDTSQSEFTISESGLEASENEFEAPESDLPAPGDDLEISEDEFIISESELEWQPLAEQQNPAREIGPVQHYTLREIFDPLDIDPNLVADWQKYRYQNCWHLGMKAHNANFPSWEKRLAQTDRYSGLRGAKLGSVLGIFWDCTVRGRKKSRFTP